MTTAVEAEPTAETSEATNEAAEQTESPEATEDATTEAAAPAPESPVVALQEKYDRIAKKQQNIEGLERIVAEAEADWTALKADASEAKKCFDAAVSRLRAAIRRHDDERELPFPKDEEAKAGDDEAAQAEPEKDESWRATTLEELGITGKLAEHLQNAELNTLGDIANFTATPGVQLTDIEGVGPAKAEIVENAMVAFWERRNSTAPETSEDGTGSDDEDEDDSEAEDEE